jgi:chemotaxis protein methyltransferase CheR
MDVVLLRNVLIYFGPETRREVLTNVRQVIRPDGCLILGSSETNASLEHPFEPQPVGRTVVHFPRGARAA